MQETFCLTVTIGEVTTLNHELLDDSVESRALKSEALLASSESTEVLRSLGHSLSIQSHDNPAEWFISMNDVEIDLVTAPSAC
jgi:hypothetical protein